MRAVIFAAIMSLLCFGTVQAAPICQTQEGHPAKCGTSDAMPLGWTPSPEQVQAWKEAGAANPNTKATVTALVWIALLLALIALMPDFQGRDKWDWDRQEDDRFR